MRVMMGGHESKQRQNDANKKGEDQFVPATSFSALPPPFSFTELKSHQSHLHLVHPSPPPSLLLSPSITLFCISCLLFCWHLHSHSTFETVYIISKHLFSKRGLKLWFNLNSRSTCSQWNTHRFYRKHSVGLEEFDINLEVFLNNITYNIIFFSIKANY